MDGWRLGGEEGLLGERAEVADPAPPGVPWLLRRRWRNSITFASSSSTIASSLAFSASVVPPSSPPWESVRCPPLCSCWRSWCSSLVDRVSTSCSSSSTFSSAALCWLLSSRMSALSVSSWAASFWRRARREATWSSSFFALAVFSSSSAFRSAMLESRALALVVCSASLSSRSLLDWAASCLACTRAHSRLSACCSLWCSFSASSSMRSSDSCFCASTCFKASFSVSSSFCRFLICSSLSDSSLAFWASSSAIFASSASISSAVAPSSSGPPLPPPAWLLSSAFRKSGTLIRLRKVSWACTAASSLDSVSSSLRRNCSSRLALALYSSKSVLRNTFSSMACSILYLMVSAEASAIRPFSSSSSFSCSSRHLVLSSSLRAALVFCSSSCVLVTSPLKDWFLELVSSSFSSSRNLTEVNSDTLDSAF
mmetsp:Transcript_20391/g.29508  ORF Transcript_20391/g.29508 Transcript_20391/m.29508 type:complete len:426 (+) Transcript_20391:138-1415(+)